MPEVSLFIPGPGDAELVEHVHPGDSVKFEFTAASALVTRSGADLVIIASDGGTVIVKGFGTIVDRPDAPKIVVDGKTIPGQAVWAKLQGGEAVPVSSVLGAALGSGHFTEYAAAGNLMGGSITSLGEGPRNPDPGGGGPGGGGTTPTDPLPDPFINHIPSLRSLFIDEFEDRPETFSRSGQALLGAVLGDGEGSFSWVNPQLPAQYGTFVRLPSGFFTYVLGNDLPAVQALGNGEVLTEVFSYRYTDQNGDSAQGTLTVRIHGTNDVPQVEAASAQVAEDTQTIATGTLPAPTDVDAHDHPVFITQSNAPGTYGTISLAANGNYTYVLNNALAAVQALGVGEHLTETFTYTVADGHGGIATNTLTITINGTNDLPVVGAATATVTEDTSITATGMLPAPTDVDTHDHPAFVAQTNISGAYGTFSLQANGTYTYELNNSLSAVQALGVNEHLTESFLYTVDDGHGGTAVNTLTITINGTNDVPYVAASTAVIAEDTPSINGSLPVPTDVDTHDTPLFVAQSGVAGQYGSLTYTAGGEYLYTLNNSLLSVQSLGVGEHLTDTFTYTVADGHGGFATNTLTITINGTNDLPVVDAATATVTEDTSITATGMLPAPTDVDTHDHLAFVAQTNSSGAYGTFSLQANGTYTYELNNSLSAVQALGVNEHLTESFLYTVDDGHGGTAVNTLTITINGTNDVPYVAASTAVIAEDTPSINGSLPVPTDVDTHDTPLFVAQSGVAGQYGSLTYTAGGEYLYTLNNSLLSVQSLGVGEHLTDTFTYTVADGHGGFATNTLTITINGTNDSPVVGSAVANVIEDFLTVAHGDLPNPTDVDTHDHPEYVSQVNTQGAYGRLSIDTDGDYTYRLNNSLAAVQALGFGETMHDVFTYTVADGHGGFATNTLTITIYGTNDFPRVGATVDAVTEDTDLVATGSFPAPTDVDAHDTPLFIPRSNVPGLYGSLSYTANGEYVYTLNNTLLSVQRLGVGEHATDLFVYTVSDGHGGFALNTLTITINGTNDRPVVGAASNTVTEDLQTTASGTLPHPTDVDAHDHPVFVAQANTAGAYGTLSLNAAGSYSYVLNNSLAAVQGLGVGEQLTDTFTYTVSDGHGGTNTNILTITVNGTNDAPYVAAATDSATEDTAILVNGTLPAPTDVDVHDHPVFVAQSGTNGLYGTLGLNADGSYTYALNNSMAAVQGLGVGETLTDTFTYTVSDGHGGTASNTLTITINGTNDIPTVAAATDSIAEDTASISGALPPPADVDVHDQPVFIAINSLAGSYGTLSLTAAGTYTYVLSNSLNAVQSLGVGEHLTDTFTYTVSDGHGGTASNTLTITINGTNDAPTVGPATASVIEDLVTMAHGDLPNPHDVDAHDHPVFTAQSNTPGAYGSLTIDANGEYTYRLSNSLPAVQALSLGDIVTDVFTYAVSDGHGGTATSTLTVYVFGTNDRPTVGAASDTVTEDTDLVASGFFPAPQDIDAHDQPVFIPRSNVIGSYGTLSYTASGAYIYTLNNNLGAVQSLGAGEHLTESFTYLVSDGHGGFASNTFSVTINGTNDAPVVGQAVASVQEDTDQIAYGALPAPTDADAHDHPVFVAQSNTPGAYGSLSIDAQGNYTYVLNNALAAVQGLGQGETVTDVFIYTVSDGHGGTGTNTLTITVNGTNDTPFVAASSAVVVEDSALTATGTFSVPVDVDVHDTPVFIPQSNVVGSYGTLTYTAGGSYVYTLNNSLAAVQALGVGEHLTDTFTYTVTDGHGGTATNIFTVTVNGTNDQPFVASAAATVTEDTATVAVGLLPTPTDVDVHDHPVFITQNNAPGSYGALTLNAAGGYTYTLNNSLAAVQALGAGEHLTDTFTYTVTDGHGGTATNTLTITVNGTNDAPFVAAATASVKEDTQVSVSGNLPAPTDVDLHDVPVFISQSATAGAYGTLSLTSGGSYVYTLNNSSLAVQSLGVGERVTDTFSYTVSDGHGGFAVNTLTVTVNGTNDAPTVSAATNSIYEDMLSVSGTVPPPVDVDAHDSPRFTVQLGTQGNYGTLTLGSDGVYTYVLNNSLTAVQALNVGDHLVETFAFTVSDGHGGTASSTLTITINGTNDAPQVSPATATVIEDLVPMTLGFLPDPHDVDNNAHLQFVQQQNVNGTYGSLNIEPNGHYKYTLDNNSPQVQALGAGEQVTDVFTYQVTDEHGAVSQSTLTIIVMGTNDIPAVGAATATVTEDTSIVASGTLPAPTDVDAHDVLVFLPQTNSPGNYGTFTLAANGSYTYNLNNTLAAVQGLGVGEHLTETFSYTVSDGHGGTATNTMTITINGTNDVPVVGPATANVQEDTNLTASGFLPSPTDVDTHDNPVFIQQQNVNGLYGSLNLEPNGHYAYSLNNNLAAVQGLGVGEHLTEVFTYTVSDGHGGTAANTLTITINGTNDIPTVGARVASIAEDTASIQGSLPSPADVDVHDVLVFVQQNNTAGSYGTLSVTAGGTYTYALNNSLAAVQALGVGEHLTEVFNYTVSDGHGGTATNTLTITINGTNDNPVVGAATATTTEDTVLTASGTLPAPTDVDVHDNPVFVTQSAVAASYGTFTLAVDGSYTYTLNNSLAAVQGLGVGEKLTDVITYTVTDGHGGLGTNVLTVTINGTNDTPFVAAATTTIVEDTATKSGNLPTPTDVDIHDVPVFVAQSNTPGAYGTLTLSIGGAYTYKLTNTLTAVQQLGVGESLTDVFTYTVNDGHGGTAVNTLTVTIQGRNDNPVVAACTATVTEDTTLTASGNFPTPTDVDIHDTVAFIPRSNVAGTYGTLTYTASGSYVYTLNNSLASVQRLGAGESVTDIFTYTVRDSQGGTGTNRLTVTINGTNDNPVVGAATATVTEDSQTTASGTLPTPTDVDIHDTLSFVPQTNAAGAYGSMTLMANGSYTYTLNNSLASVQALGVGETLTDTFTYTVSDGKGGTATNTLTITVNGTNDTPYVGASTATVSEDIAVTASGALTRPTDVDIHDTLVFDPMTNVGGVYGKLSVDAAGNYVYVLNNASSSIQSLGVGESVTDTFVYTVRDGHGGVASNTITITINGTNDLPVVGSASNRAAEDSILTASGQLPQPRDADAHDLPVFAPMAGQAGTYGTLTLNAAGVYTYQLNNASSAVQGLSVGQTAYDVFTYTVTDGHGGTSTNTLTIAVSGANDRPTVAPTSTIAIEDTRTTVSGSLSTPVDVDVLDTVTFAPKTNEAGIYGTLQLNADGTYTYVLNNSLSAVQKLSVGDTLTDSFVYTVVDSHGAASSATLTVTIQGNNDAPVLGTRTGSVTEDTQLVASGSLGGSDIDAHDTLTYTPVSNLVGQYGTLNINANGTYTYTLNNSLAAVQGLGIGESLQESFVTGVSDGHGPSVAGTLTIVIRGTNDAPTVAALGVSVSEDTNLVANGQLPTPVDADIHDHPVFTPMTNEAGLYGTLSIGANGAYTYSLNNSMPAVQQLGEGQTLTETFTYVVQDGHGGVGYNTLTITVNGTNDNPTVEAGYAALYFPDVKLEGTLPTPSDIDRGDMPTFIAGEMEGKYGTLSLNKDGTYTYKLDQGHSIVAHPGEDITYIERFTYQVTDGHGGTATNTLTITLFPRDDDDGEGNPHFHAVAASDSVQEDVLTTAKGELPDPVNHSSQVEYTPQSTQGHYGTLTVNENGEYVYTLNNSLDVVQALGEGASLSESFTYEVHYKDHSDTSTLTITINGTNDAPVITPVVNTVTEDSVYVATGHIGGTDVDTGDLISYEPKSGEAGHYGTLILNSNGTYAYILNNSLAAVQALGAGESVSDVFTVNAQDLSGASTSSTLTIVINGTNDAPTVGGAFAQVREDIQTTVNGTIPAPVDVDAHDTYTVVAQNNVAGLYGTLSLNANGTYTYTLNNSLTAVQALGAGESLSDSFSYTIRDSQGVQASSTLTIGIQGTNDIPTLAATTGTVTEDGTQYLMGMLPRPVDVDIHDTHTFSLSTQAGQYGTFTVTPNGFYTFVLNNTATAVQALGVGESLTESFVYTARDSAGATVTNSFTVTINGTNDLPTVAPATGSITEDTPSVSGLLPVPADTDTHDILAYTPQSATAGSYGSLNLDAAGNYTYVLNNSLTAVQALQRGEQLVESFSYTVHDNHGGTATNTLAITINGTNDAPVVGPAVAAVSEDTQTSVSGNLPAPTDVDAHDTPTFVAQSGIAGTYGTFTLGVQGGYSYVLNNTLPAVQQLGLGESLTETFTYTVTDGQGGTASNTLTITINGTNDLPLVGASTASINEDTAAVSGVLPSPTDVDVHDVLTFTPLSNQAGSYGSLSLDAQGNYSYSLNNSLIAVQSLGVGERLTDTFNYIVGDGHGGFATNTLTVTINGTNDAPVVGAALAQVKEDSALTATGLLPVPTDVDAHDILVFVPQTGAPGSYGSFSLTAAGSYTYTLNNSLAAVQGLGVGEHLTDTLSYTVSDGHGGFATNTLTVTINGTNDAPVVGAGTASINEDTAAVSGVLPSPTDVDVHDVLTFTPLSNQAGSYGSLTLDAQGNYTYTLNNSLAAVQGLGVGESLADTFNYTVGDGHGGFVTNTLSVSIHGTNDAPMVEAAVAQVTEDSALTATGLLPVPTDADIHDTVVFVPQTGVLGSYGSFTLTAAGAYTYTLNNSLDAVQGLGVGEHLTDTLSYTVSDGHGGFGTNTLTVTINGSNDVPVIGPATANVTEDTDTMAMGFLPAPFDRDVHDETVFGHQQNSEGAYGSLNLEPNGHYTYTLANDMAAVQALGVGEHLTDVFVYSVSDGHGGTVTSTFSILIDGTNDAPTVGASVAAITEDTHSVSGVLPVAVDVDANDVPQYVPQSEVAGHYGTFSLTADGSYVYHLDNSLPEVQGLGLGEHTTESFTYTVADGHGGFASNTLTLTISGTNDLPVVGAATATVTENADVHAIGFLPQPVDADTSDHPVFVQQHESQGQYGTLDVQPDGHYTYALDSNLVHSLNSGDTAQDVFTYAVSDGHGTLVENTLTIHIHGADDAPLLFAAPAMMSFAAVSPESSLDQDISNQILSNGALSDNSLAGHHSLLGDGTDNLLPGGDALHHDSGLHVLGIDIGDTGPDVDSIYAQDNSPPPVDPALHDLLSPPNSLDDLLSVHSDATHEAAQTAASSVEENAPAGPDPFVVIEPATAPADDSAQGIEQHIQQEIVRNHSS